MAEYSRSKEIKKKSDFYLNKEYRRSSIQLVKSDKEFPRDFSKKTLLSPAVKEEKQQPTILIKAREGDRPVSPSLKTPNATTPKKEDVPQPIYQLQSKPSAEAAPTPQPMSDPTKLLDLDNCSLIDNCLENLAEQTDFLVVGIVGYEGVGKSTVLSWLADPQSSTDGNYTFHIQGIEELETSEHKTNGIDMFVTKNRMILLDSQPVMSASIKAKYIKQDLSTIKKLQHGDLPLEATNVEIQSLQLVTFLFSVCHLVIFVQDYCFDPDFLRFIQTAEMLKPSTPTSVDENMVDYFPHVIFLHNKAQPDEFQSRRIKDLQDVYCKTFMNSRLQFQTGFGISNGEVDPVLNQETCGELVNLYLLPSLGSDEDYISDQKTFEYLMKELRRQILSTPRTPLTHTALTEKNWYLYSCKVWDGIKKSSFFSEYNRLLSLYC